MGLSILKKATSMMLTTALVAALIATPVQAAKEDPKKEGLGSSYGNAMVAVARSELATYVPGTGGSRYWSAYANYTGTQYSSDTPWCVAFVYYCAYECGYLTPEGDGCFGSQWQIGCRYAWDWFYKRGLVHTGTDYKPVPGDLIMYGTESTDPANPKVAEHIGIVEYVSENGTLTTIEGNAYNTLKRCIYPSYLAGSYAFDTSNILGYIHPTYPEMIPDGPIYSYIPGLIRSSPYARIICSGTYSTVMAGDVRMIGNDLAKFIRMIPELDKKIGTTPSVQEMISVLNYEGEGKLLKLVDAWNNAYRTIGDPLIELQTRYSVDTHISPVHQAAYSRTGFDWMKTDIRKEILWEVATITTNAAAAGLVLASFASGLDNNATDADVVKAYNSWLPFITTAFRQELWGGYDHDTVEFWIKNMKDFGQVMEFLSKEMMLSEAEQEELLGQLTGTTSPAPRKNTEKGEPNEKII